MYSSHSKYLIISPYSFRSISGIHNNSSNGRHFDVQNFRTDQLKSAKSVFNCWKILQAPMPKSKSTQYFKNVEICQNSIKSILNVFGLIPLKFLNPDLEASKPRILHCQCLDQIGALANLQYLIIRPYSWRSISGIHNNSSCGRHFVRSKIQNWPVEDVQSKWPEGFFSN